MSAKVGGARTGTTWTSVQLAGTLPGQAAAWNFISPLPTWRTPLPSHLMEHVGATQGSVSTAGPSTKQFPVAILVTGGIPITWDLVILY